MRRAVWRVRADDPKTPLGWWWREVRERDRWLWLRLAVLALFVAAAFGGFHGHSAFTWPLPIAVFLSGSLLQRRNPRRLLALLPDPPPVETFVCDVTIRQGRITTGVDVAALSFVDGFLHVDGLHASFALRAADVRWTLSDWDDTKARLRLTDDPSVTFAAQNRSKAFCAALQSWSNEPAAEGEPVFPPATAHPREFARWAVWSGAGVGLISLPNGVAALLHLGSQFADAKIGVALVGFGISTWGWRCLGQLAACSREAKRREAFAGQAPPLQGSSQRSRDAEGVQSEAKASPPTARSAFLHVEATRGGFQAVDSR